MSNVRPPQFAMQNTIKIAIASALLLLLGSGFLFVGGSALTRGFFYISRYQIAIIHQDQSSLFFYAYVVHVLFFGGILLAAGVAVWFSRGEIRREVISFVDSAILSHPSPRWSLMALTIVVAAVFIGIALFGL
jgi:hypothetical protein